MCRRPMSIIIIIQWRRPNKIKLYKLIYFSVVEDLNRYIKKMLYAAFM